MRDEEEDIEIIEAYLRGTLDGQALVAFQKRRQDDPEFDREVADYTQIISQIRASKEKDFVNKMKRWDSEIDNPQPAKVISLRTFFSIAASVLVFAAAGVYVFWNSQADHEELFQEYFKPYENVISQRAGKSSYQQQGMELYDQKKYDEAIVQLELAAIEDPDNLSLKCYIGISHLAEGRTKEAEKIFQALALKDHSLFKEVGEWNLAMTYLKLDNQASLKKTLIQIVEQKDHLYHEEASTLLNRL